MSYGAITGQKPETPDIPQPGLKWELVKSGDFQLITGTNPNGKILTDNFPLSQKDIIILVKLNGEITFYGKVNTSSEIILNVTIGNSSGVELADMNWYSQEGGSSDSNKAVVAGQAIFIQEHVFSRDNYSPNKSNTEQYLYYSIPSSNNTLYISGNYGQPELPIEANCEFYCRNDSANTRVKSSNLHYDIYVGKISI